MPQGRLGVWLLGHRLSVGGKWDTMGPHQFEFMRRQGLEPEHYLLDIGCGALRGGVHFIRYLDPGHYMGFDKERALVDSGLRHEVGDDLAREERPQLVTNIDFDFASFAPAPDFALAESVFSHLTAVDVARCLRSLRRLIDGHGHRFFATFIVGDSSANAKSSHAHGRYMYEPAELAAIATDAGWLASYLGEWTPNRSGQHMMEFRPATSP
jgi:SAM-dependent methyltransferase